MSGSSLSLGTSQNTKGRLLVGAPLLLLTSYLSLLLFRRDQFGQPALNPGRRVLVDDALASGAIEEFDRLGIGLRCLGTGGGADLLERRPELAPVGAIVNGPGAALAHAFGGGLDTGQDNLGNERVRSGDSPEGEPENIGRTLCKVKREAALTLPSWHV